MAEIKIIPVRTQPSGAAPAPVGSPPPPADPIPTTAPLSAESKTEDNPPGDNPILGKLAQARTAGLSWSDINTYLADKRTEAKAAGLTDDDVDKFLGFRDTPSADTRVKADLQAHLTPETTNLFDAVVEGLEKSSGGLAIRGKLPSTVPPEDANLAMRIASKLGETFGDLPAMVVGALGGSAAGGVAGSEVPVIGNIGGAIAGGGFGAMALPQAMKSTYRDLYLNGNFKGPGDYAARVGAHLMDSFKSGVSGASMGLGAEAAAGGAASLGFKSFAPQLGAKAAGALAASTAVSGLIERQIPSPSETMDNAILLIAMGGIGHVVDFKSANDTKLLANVQANLLHNWVENNERPAEALKRAQEDPVFRAKLVAPVPPAPPEGSVSVKTDGVGPYIIPKFELPEAANKNEAPKAVVTENGMTTEYDTKTKEPVAAYPEGSFGDIVSKAAVKHGLDPQLLLGIAHLESASGTDLRTSSAGAKGPFQFIPSTARAYGIEGREMDTAASADAAARLAVDNAKGLQVGLGRAPTNGEIYLAHQQGVEGALKLLKNPNETAASQIGVKAVRANLPPNLQSQAATMTASQFAQHWTSRFSGGGPGGGAGGAVPVGVAGGGNINQPPAGGGAGGTPLGPPYDPWAIVAGRQAARVDQPNIIQRTLGAGYRAYLELFNPDHPMNQLADAGNGHVVPGGPNVGDPKFLARMAELSNNLTQYMVERRMIDINGNPTGVRGLNDILSPFANERGPVNFFTYAMARWAAEKAAQARETGVLIGAANDVVTQGNARYAAGFQELVDWQNETLRYLADGHMISMEAYNQFVADNQNYIPGFRIGQNPRGVGNGPGRTTYNSVHEFLGSEDPVQHILTNILRNAFVRVELARRNLANRSLRDTGLNTIDNVTGQPTAEVVPNQARPITLTDQELQNLGIPGGLGGLADPADATIFRIMNRQTREDEVPVFEDGQLQRVRFADPEITRALRGLNEQQQTVFSRIMSSITRVTRAAIVLNPFFPIRILAYDIPWQFITKPGFRSTVADAVVGAAHVLGNSPAFDEWMRSGGAERIFDGLSKNAYISDVLRGHEDPSFGHRVWNAITTPVHLLRAWGQTISQFQRVGRFVRGRDAGESMARAGVASSEAAFHRGGYGGPVGKFINGVQPFFLAHLNGLEQTFRSQMGNTLTRLTGDENRTTTGEKFNGFQFTAKAVATITIPMLTSWAMNHDKEWYKGAPDWQKNNGLLFHFGPDDGGHTMYLPFPPLISAIYGGIPRMLLDAYAGDNPIEGKKLAEAALGSLLPPGAALSSNVFLPIIEHVSNHSFFRDQPLVSDNTKNNALPAQQEAPFTSEPAKAMAKFFSDLPLTKGLNLSPAVVDNYIKGWGGTMGDAASRAATILLHAADPKAEPTRLEDWPLLSSWLERFPSASAQPIKDFQAGTAELQQAHGSLEALMLKGDLAGFQKVLKDYPLATLTSPLQLSQQQQVRGQGVDYQPFVDAYRATADMVDPSIASTVKLTDKALAAERLTVASIYANPDMSKADKSQLTDRAYSQMQLIAETGLRALRKARP